ncbi:type I DNA topoisomerase [uncultured Allobaculum sp.]|uniref:type I DNA topoisomerase n=1 Tax=uncultured Allobaculum sp. TaxID=1187017 RepID=UPI002585F47F|nr:type I DNA topoisomerase [uncultured Allobaculum sp.]
MKKKLVIVESPSKAKTIEKYLGDSYKVVSSKGHICDLATSGKGGLGIDIEHDFKPTYRISKEKKEVVKELKSLASKSDGVILASDPDREGEAIAWHLARELGLSTDDNNRVTFHEITKPVVTQAIQDPHQIDMNLVRSQEARRILDRIIGFKLSKLLQNKIQSKSAGRVQSVALRLIVEREEEIRKFVAEEYWTIEAKVKKGNSTFEASLTKVDGKKAEIKNEQEANAILERAKSIPFTVKSVSTRKKSKAPKLPFTTSTLQQESSTKLGYGAKKTMNIAQKLYEGVDLGGTTTGLISYMRTDSTRLSPLFVTDAENYIDREYGSDYKGTAHQKNSTNAQDAHEAIRPTDITQTPDKVRPYLTNEQYRLYSLIYARTLSSLMADAQFNVTSVKFEADGCEFSASGQTMLFDGYTKVYSKYEKQTNSLLPVMKPGEVMNRVEILSSQHFTEPPARYTEARLIKTLEEKSIGRPSTYASIIDTLQNRSYVTLEPGSEGSKTKVFRPTEQGELTNSKLQEFFRKIINVQYTADMEKNLDIIAEGQEDYVEFLKEFYDDFEPLVEKAYEKMPKKELEKVGRACPDCGGDLVYRNGRYGKFISCINYPTCKYTENADPVLNELAKTEKICPECGSHMQIKKGRFGPFWACTRYPECKHIEPLKEKAKPKPTGEMCPECGSPLVERISRYGKPFVGCSNYPKCRYIKKTPKAAKDVDPAQSAAEAAAVDAAVEAAAEAAAEQSAVASMSGENS